MQAAAMGQTEFDPAQAGLPPLREDLLLQPATPGIDGAPHWHLYDPVRNRFFRIGWLEFELLARWRTAGTVGAACEAVRAGTTLEAEVDDVLDLIQFLQANELVRADARESRVGLHRMAERRMLTIWQWLLHHYLFIRIPLLHPDRFLTLTLPWIRRLLRPALVLTAGGLGLLGLSRVVLHWDDFARTFLYFFSWHGLLLYGAALACSKLLHELGHAYVAKYYGLRVPTMGVALMMMWPLLYTDTSEGWKLRSRRARLAIGGAGMVAELLLAGLAALAWSLLPEGAPKSAMYILAATTWVATLLVNLNPFMRFDGYYLLMDAIDMPNLHERSFAFGRWYLRRLLLGIHDDMPEPELAARRGWLIAYAWATWLYRLVMFIGIAAAVYYFFVKAVGIVLFAVEVGWFLVRPVWNELRAWWRLRARWLGRPQPLILLALLAGGVVLMAVPWRGEVVAEGYWQAASHTRLYPPTAARVERILVREGQAVSEGQLLFVLRAPELDNQWHALEARRAGLEAQLSGAIGDAALLERAVVLEQEYLAAQASLKAVREDMARLLVRAPREGHFRDLAYGLYEGAWVGPQQILGRVTGSGQVQVQAFVAESDVSRLRIGAPARVLVRRAETSRHDAVVSSIDATATRVLPEALLGSPYGGPIAARQGPHGELSANEALYRVTLRVDPADLDSVAQLAGVTVHIEARRGSALSNLARAVAGVLVRESGF
jgi:putative peptide zinc metalloprotease protein